MKYFAERGHQQIAIDFNNGVSNKVIDSIKAFGDDMIFEAPIQINPQNPESPVRDVDFISEANNVVGEIKTGIWTAQEQASAIAQVRANAFGFSKAHGNVDVTIVVTYVNGKSGQDSKPFTISAVQPFSIMEQDFEVNCVEQFMQEEIAVITNAQNIDSKVKDTGSKQEQANAAARSRARKPIREAKQAAMVAFQQAKKAAHIAAKAEAKAARK